MLTTPSNWEWFQRVIDTRDFFNARRDFLKTSRPEVSARRYLNHVEVVSDSKQIVLRILSDLFSWDSFRTKAARSILDWTIYEWEPRYR